MLDDDYARQRHQLSQLVNRNASEAQIARMFGVRVAEVGALLQKYRLFWTPPRVQILRDHATARKSATAIAALMGVSRDAVAGAARKHNIKLISQYNVRGAAHRIQKRRSEASAGDRKPTAVELRRLAIEPAPCGPVRDFPGTDCCRWIHGDTRGPAWQCCGAPVEAGSSYCAHHAQRTRTARKPSPEEVTIGRQISALSNRNGGSARAFG